VWLALGEVVLGLDQELRCLGQRLPVGLGASGVADVPPLAAVEQFVDVLVAFADELDRFGQVRAEHGVLAVRRGVRGRPGRRRRR